MVSHQSVSAGPAAAAHPASRPGFGPVLLFGAARPPRRPSGLALAPLAAAAAAIAGPTVATGCAERISRELMATSGLTFRPDIPKIGANSDLSLRGLIVMALILNTNREWAK